MPDFYDSQNEEIKIIIAEMNERFSDLGNANTPEHSTFMSLKDFARAIMSIESALNSPDAFDKWMENEEIEFKESLIQEAMKKVSTSQPSSYYVRLIIFYLMLYYFPPPEKVVVE